MIPISASAQSNPSEINNLVMHCNPVETGYGTFQLCVQLNPITDCEGWYLGPVPPLGYQIWSTDTIPYGHYLGIQYWGPAWLSGTWADDKVQETFQWTNGYNIGIYFPDGVFTGYIPLSIPITEPATCGPKVTICHRDLGAPGYKAIEISKKALQAHLDHGDVYPDPVLGCD